MDIGSKIFFKSVAKNLRVSNFICFEFYLVPMIAKRHTKDQNTQQ